MPTEQDDSQQRRTRHHGAKNSPISQKNHTPHRKPHVRADEKALLPESMREVITDAGTFVFDDTLSPSISYFLFRPDHDEVSEAFEQNILAGEPLDVDTMQALHYIAELRLSDGWQTLMADLYIDRDLVDDYEVHEIVESALVLLDDIEPGPEGTSLTVYWVQEIGVFSPETLEYPSPVSVLMEKGEPDLHNWEDYTALGLTEEHIPDLIRMVVDTQLYWSHDPLLYFAPVHAWRALGQLRAADAVFYLLTLFDMADELDGDYIDFELHKVFGMIGAPAIDPLVEYIGDHDGAHSMWSRISGTASLEAIGIEHPDHRERVIGEICQLLTEELKDSQRQPVDEEKQTHIGFLVYALRELGALGALPLIRECYAANIVDDVAAGSLEDIEQKMGGDPKDVKK